ncbi:hypothetical protein D0884_26440 (plasmid) [Klebsiella pneumoniae]|nr:hypothetical protein D0884_26440 [Klebsiella pneumoniae]
MIQDDVITKYMHEVTRLWLMFWKVLSPWEIWKTYGSNFLLKIHMRSLNYFGDVWMLYRLTGFTSLIS